jgi:hypothetical protein
MWVTQREGKAICSVKSELRTISRTVDWERRKISETEGRTQQKWRDSDEVLKELQKVFENWRLTAALKGLKQN